jgi:hypothetical protein
VSEDVAGDEPYLLVEEVADRLGLPLSVLLHRVEAGDIPSRRIEAEDGVHYALRLGDLGIELGDEGMRASAIEDDEESSLSATFEPPSSRPADGGIVFEPSDSAGVENAIVSAFNSGPQPVPTDRPGVPDGEGPTKGRAAGDAAGPVAERHGAANGSEPVGERPPAEEPAAPVWSARPREPQQPPPPWIIQGPSHVDDAAAEEGVVTSAESEPTAEEAEAKAELPLGVQPEAEQPRAEAEARPDQSDDAEAEDDGIPALIHAADAEEEDELDEETVIAELAVPPPGRVPLGLLDTPQSPRGDLASMSLDARELVAGLLDRWERTLEQRIYTEQRQRFQAELVARQNMVKQLQMELQTARAEHAAAQAEKERILVGKERELADRERDLADTRRTAEEAQRAATPVARRRRWFRGRDD